jgi:hypothetical protein
MSKRKLPNEWNESSCDDSGTKNEKDFAKLKDDLVGEEHNTDPDPKGTNQPYYDSDNSGSALMSPPRQFNDSCYHYDSEDDSDVDSGTNRSNQSPPSIDVHGIDFGYQGRSSTYTIPKGTNPKSYFN